MKKFILILTSMLWILSCKKNDTTSGLATGDRPDVMTPAELKSVEDEGVDSLATIGNALFANGTSINEWLEKNDSGYGYVYGRQEGLPPSLKVDLFIGRMMKAGYQLTDDKLHVFSSQPYGLAYVYGSRTITQPQIGTESDKHVPSVCQTPLYGTDCSGMIYLMARAAGVPFQPFEASTKNYSDVSFWNKAMQNSLDFNGLEMVNLGKISPDDLIPGDIVVSLGHHIGMVCRNATQPTLNVLNSLGSPDFSCARNSNAWHGPIVTKNVSHWLDSVFKSTYQVLRIFQKNLPVVTTSIFLTLTQTSATCSGKIDINGGAEIIERGICWSTQPNPTTADSVVVCGKGSGIFAGTLSDLLAYPSYYVRAYATNSSGTAYGNEISFTPVKDSIFTDKRDGQEYSFRHIGDQVWMTRNLSFYVGPIHDTVTSCTYADEASFGAVYGLLYDWGAALAAIPEGWHLPKGKEYTKLYEYLGRVTHTDGYSVDEVLKSKILWDPSITQGNNISGFSALPAGGRGPIMYEYDGKHSYDGVSFVTHWWNADETENISAGSASYFGINKVYIDGGSGLTKKAFCSVRCIRN